MKKWDSNRAKQLQVGDKLMWRHTKQSQYEGKVNQDKLYKEITIKSIREGIIKTNFGSYDLHTGRNTFEACGCKRFCDCYGRLEFN